MTGTDEMFSGQDELDFSGDSAVEIVTADWTITEVEQESTDSDKGTGERLNLTFASEDFPFDIPVRLFTKYESKNGVDTAWVNRQRGTLKAIFKAALGEPKGHPQALVGKRVNATTRDGGDGFPTLGKFKAVKTDS